MAALPDLSFAFEGGHIEADHAALDRDHLCRGPHRGADQRGREMSYVDLGADSDPAVSRKPRMASPEAISISRIIIGVA